MDRKAQLTKRIGIFCAVVVVIVIIVVIWKFSSGKTSASANTAVTETGTTEDTADISTDVSTDGEMSQMIPVLNGKETTMQYDTSTLYWIDYSEVSSSEYESYVTACQEVGFTVDAEVESGWKYEASNEEGYLLKLIYNMSTEVLTVMLNTPES